MIGPIELIEMDVLMFVVIFLLIVISISGYLLHSYIKRKQFQKYAQERKEKFQEKMAQINNAAKKSSE